MPESMDYWVKRSTRVSRLSRLKTSPIVQSLFSVRIGDEAFLRQALKVLKDPLVLDIACGAGKLQLPAIASRLYGVDIAGFPKHIAIERGYRIIEYGPPHYNFTLRDRVNVLCCVDLNAHIEFPTFRKILQSCLCHLEPGGLVVLIGEFDNDGLCYRFLKLSRRRFTRYVRGMKHWHFTFESRFTTEFEAAFPHLKRVRRSEVVCIPPLSHFYACLFNKDANGPVMKTLFYVGDVLLSLVNNAMRMFPRVDSAFRVGFVYKHRPDV